jgi:hypothetical protein
MERYVEKDPLVEMILTSPDVLADFDSYAEGLLSGEIRHLMMTLIDDWLHHGLNWATDPLNSHSLIVTPDAAFVKKITKCFEM